MTSKVINMTKMTIIKPVKWEGVVVFKVKSKKALRDLSKVFKGHMKRNKISMSFTSKKGKLEKVV